MTPPMEAVHAAEVEAAQSPCAKSKRGAVIFDTRTLGIVGGAYNRPPLSLACDGSSECRTSCAKRCLHAESLALRLWQAVLDVQRDPGDPITDPAVFDLVHVKIDHDGRVIAGGGPSCWQCAREVLDAGLGGVWLFEGSQLIHRPPVWARYSAEEFWTATCAECGVHP